VPGYQSNFEFDSTNVTLFGSHKVDDIEMSVDLNTRNKKTEWLYNYDGSTVSSGSYYAPYTTAWGNTNSKSTTNSFSPRAKLNNFIVQNNSITFGYDWSKWDMSSMGIKNNTAWGFENRVAFAKKSAANKSEGLYFYDDWKATSTDRILLGARRQRYSQYGQTAYGANPSYIGTYTIGNDTYTYPSDGTYGHQVRQYLNSYEMQYSKKLGFGFEPYIKKGNSFRLPTADDNGLTSTLQPLRPQISRDEEIGLKWNDNQSMMKVSLFRSNLTDEIVFSGGTNQNQAPTLKKGVDTAFTHKFNSIFSIRANIQIINAEISHGVNAGKKTPGVAQKNGGLGLETKLNNNHIVDISARGASGKYASEDNQNTQGKTPGYLVGDLSYIIKDKTWTWVARVNNILDKRYSDYSIYKSSNYDDPFKMTLYPNPGRNFSISGRYVF
jgi:outer membrane cobalamin receptor